MFKNYLIIAFRNIWRKKVFSIINIVGFSIGTCACLLIIAYISGEIKMNRNFPNGKQIYRVNYFYYQNKELASKATFSFPSLKREMKDEFPEIEASARIYYGKAGTVKVDNNYLNQENILTVDTSFLDMFAVKVIAGEKNAPLRDPQSALITVSTAHKFFGDQNPIGKTIYINKKEPFIISGIIEDPNPLVSIFQYSILLPYHHLNSGWEWNWYNYEVQTFFQLKKGTDYKALQSKFPAFVARKKPDNVKQNIEDVFQLQSIENVHLYDEVSGGVWQNLLFMGFVVFFIFLIACINYINLSIARASERAKEVGMRKVMGATVNQIRFQFLTETLIMNGIAIALSLIGVFLLLPHFETLTERNLNLGLEFWLYVPLMWLIGTFASGFYISFVQSSFEPMVVLKGRVNVNFGGINLRKFLLIFQFIASISLIIASLAVYSQLQYMKTRSLGVNTRDIIAIKAPDINDSDSMFTSRLQTLKMSLSRIQEIEYVTASSMFPGKRFGGIHNWIKKEGENEYDKREYHVFWMDTDYINTYGLNVIAGRQFTDTRKPDEDAMMLNETAVISLGFKNATDAVGKSVVIDFGYEKRYNIIGVIKDYHQASLHHAYAPTVFMMCLGKNEQFDKKPPFWTLSIKYQIGFSVKTIEETKAIFMNLFPDSEFSYVHVEAVYNNQYKEEQRFATLFSIATVLAIFMTCIGLFGMSSYSISQRTKEIGIRKVLGSKVISIVLLLTKDYLKLMAISVVISCILMFLLIHLFLENYAVKMPISIWLFALPVLLLTTIAMLTISIQTIRAALANPIDSLKSE